MNKVLVRPGASFAYGNAIAFFTPLAGARDPKRPVGPEIIYSLLPNPHGAGRHNPPFGANT
jgi:hypothetical protein